MDGNFRISTVDTLWRFWDTNPMLNAHERNSCLFLTHLTPSTFLFGPAPFWTYQLDRSGNFDGKVEILVSVNAETVFPCPSNISLSPAQKADFDKASHCDIREQPFKLREHQVRDNLHLVPIHNSRCPAHIVCNINYKIR